MMTFMCFKNTWVTLTKFLWLSELHQCDQEESPLRNFSLYSYISLSLVSEDLFGYILILLTTAIQPRTSQ